jgi:hypothetical protein
MYVAHAGLALLTFPYLSSILTFIGPLTYRPSRAIVKTSRKTLAYILHYTLLSPTKIVIGFDANGNCRVPTIVTRNIFFFFTTIGAF